MPESQHQVQGRFFLYVIVSQCSTIFKLLASKNQALLIRWNAFLVLSKDDVSSEDVTQQTKEQNATISVLSQRYACRRYLYLGLDIIDCITAFNLKSDGLASKCLDKNLHCY